MVRSKEEILDYWFHNNKIKQCRGKKTLVEIAEETGIDQGYLSNMINGKAGIYVHRLVQIADVLHCQPADLLPPLWQSQSETQSDEMFENIALVTEVVEEYLEFRQKRLNPKAKGEFIAALCEIALKVDELQAKKAKVIEFADFALKRAG